MSYLSSLWNWYMDAFHLEIMLKFLYFKIGDYTFSRFILFAVIYFITFDFILFLIEAPWFIDV